MNFWFSRPVQLFVLLLATLSVIATATILVSTDGGSGFLTASMLIGVFVIFFSLGVKTRRRCQGRPVRYKTADGQVVVCLCDNCMHWIVVVRDTRVADGRGLEQFLFTMRMVAGRYDRVVPEISGSLRELADRLEEERASQAVA